MSDAINRALANADRMLMSAKAAASTNPMRALTQDIGGMPYSRPDLANAIIRDRYFKGHVYTAINVIAKRVAGQRVLVARTDKASGQKSFHWQPHAKSWLDDLVPLANHPLIAAIHSPNPLMTKWGLMYSTVTSLQIHGTAFWWTARGDNGKFQIWPLPSSWMLPGDNFHNTWEVRPYGVAIEPFTLPNEDVAYFNIPDHANPFLSRSPVSAQADAIEADEAIQEAQARTFLNGIFPGLAVIAGDVTDIDSGGDSGGGRPILYDHQRTQIMQTLRKFHQGIGNYGAFVILDALIRDIKPITNKPAEMDFLNSGSASKSRVFENFGVNDIIVGSTEGANRAQAVVAEETLCINVLNPIIELMSERLDASVAPRFGKSLTCWIEPARAHDKELEIEEWANALKWGVATRDEYRARVLGLPPAPGGDVFMVPVNIDPQAVDGDLTDAEDDDNDDELEEGASGADQSDKSAASVKKKRLEG